VKEVYIYTHDARLFYLLTRKLTNEKTVWIALNSFNEVPHWKNTLLITTQKDIIRYNPNFLSDIIVLKLSADMNIEEMYLRIQQAFHRIHNINKITISIDPGSVETGVALFLNDIFMDSQICYNRNQLMQIIEQYFQIFPTHYKIIKIGHGYARNTRYLVTYFFSDHFKEENVNFYKVNEYSSSQSSGMGFNKTISRHERAAISIGIRKGELITANNYQELFRINISRNAIRGIQAEARKIAKSRTIAKSVAAEVYLGKKSIAETLEESNSSD
jgi:hypothetical protein